jgi:predicted transcriptional regulator
MMTTTTDMIDAVEARLKVIADKLRDAETLAAVQSVEACFKSIIDELRKTYRLTSLLIGMNDDATTREHQ